MSKKSTLLRLGYPVILVSLSVIYFLPVVSSQNTIAPEDTSKNVTASITAKGVGFPRISYENGKDLSSDSANQSGSSAKMMASGDFDSDGTLDLVTADSGGGIKFFRGNVDSIYQNSPEAASRRELGTFVDSPFYLGSAISNIPAAPDFFAAGDFNADGHQDIIAAAKGGSVLYLFAGDGNGSLSNASEIKVDGEITQLTTGEIGRNDGQTDVVVSINSDNTSRLLVFEHPEGAFKHGPEVINLVGETNALAVGHLDEDSFGDIAVASGNRLTLVHGRGQAYPWDTLHEYDIERPAAVIETRTLPFEIVALDAGAFSSRAERSLAMLTTAGSLMIGEADPSHLRALAAKRPKIGTAATSQPGSRYAPAGHDSSRYSLLGSGTPLTEESGKQLGAFPGNEADRDEFLKQKKESVSDVTDETTLDAREQKRAAEAALSGPDREGAKANFVKAISTRPFTPLSTWAIDTLATDSRLASSALSNSAVKLVKVQVSGNGPDELALADSTSNRIHLVTHPAIEAKGRSNGQRATRTNLGTVEVVSFDVATTPAAVLPMRLNRDALSDLVVLREGVSAPTLVMTAPANTFTVNTTADDGNNSTLRNAIIAANSTPGPDMINFSVSGTIFPLFELPDIVGPVTIEASPQSIEISGTDAGETVDGIQVNASNVVIRGLVINRFKAIFQEGTNTQIGGNGIAIFQLASGNSNIARNNIIEGNYLGTDATGSLDRGNQSTGVIVFDANDNTIGGTTPAARNVLSGNGNNNTTNPRKVGVGLAIIDGVNTTVHGNHIGTNAAGDGKVNNSSGVFLAGAETDFGGDAAGAGNLVSGNGDPFPSEFNPDGCQGTGISEETLFDAGFDTLLTHDNLYRGNRIGTNAAGSAAVANCSTGLVVHPGHTAVVGSITEGGRNTISGNDENALYCTYSLRGFSLQAPLGGAGELPLGFCYIVGNNIGTDVTGTSAIPNRDVNNPNSFILFFGSLVVYHFPTLSNVGGPGGTTADACTGFCNLVSGNSNEGIGRFNDLGEVGIFNNYVGTNRTGTAAIGNSLGIIVDNSTLIGGFASDGTNLFSLGNLISGNTYSGVDMHGRHSTMEGNSVGTDRTSTTAIPNSTDGSAAPAVFLSAGPIVGGYHPLARNIISGNIGAGVSTSGGGFPDILNNYIGINAQGQPLGNGGAGVRIQQSNALVSANIIANNGGNGVYVQDTRFVGNLVMRNRNNIIRTNSTYNNTGLGIELTSDVTLPQLPDGVTLNDCLDADEGPNRLQNFPVLTAPVLNPDGTVTVGGALQSMPSRIYAVDFYWSSTTDPTDYGEGERFFGAFLVETGTDGIATFTATSGSIPVPAGSKITATATDPSGSTSEFSCFAGQCAGGTGGLAQEDLRALLGGSPTCRISFVVNINTDEPDTNPGDGVCDVSSDPGSQCSLRAAIQTTNSQPGFDIIHFDIQPGGVQTINATSQLPDIIDLVILDATSQPGYGGTPIIELNGDATTDAVGLGLASGSDNSSITGFAVNRFAFNIAIATNDVSVENCYVGLGPSGAAAGTYGGGDNQVGIDLIYSTANGNTIGSIYPEKRNVISNNNIGVRLTEGASANKVQGNRIGTNAAGTEAIPNRFGVLIESARDNIIGDAIESGNLISGNELIGIFVRNNAAENRIVKNLIGTKANGTDVLGNGDYGIAFFSGPTENVVEANVIGGHDQGETPAPAGIFFDPSTGAANSVIENFIGVDRDGQGSLANSYGIIIGADSQIIGRTDGGNIIGFNTKAGIEVAARPDGPNPITNDNVISNNLIGTNGTNDIGNGDFGIHLNGDVQDTIVKNNTVSGGTIFGMGLTDGPSDNDISSNFVGTNATGNSAIPNGGGIWIRQASNNRINSNVVSGNSIGILVGTNIGFEPNLAFVENYSSKFPAKNVGPTYTSGNQIFANTIGLNAARNAALPASIGLAIGENARSNLIDGNVISGNTASLGFGVLLGTLAATPTEDSLPQFNTFQRNLIGLGTGTQTIANKKGFWLLQAARNTIGGTSDALANYIVGNTEDGLTMLDGSRENTILKNFIGVLPPGFGGTPRPDGGDYLSGPGLGNGGHGILIRNGSQANILGGDGPNSGLVIGGNGGSGINLDSTAGNGNKIGANSIYGNDMRGIDLGANGHTPNDPGDADTGPNNLQNYPQLTARRIVNDELIIDFNVDSAPEHSAYGASGIYVQFFKATLMGQGERFIGSTFYTLADYQNGSPGTKTVNLGNINTLGITAADNITATATDAAGNTSEFYNIFTPTAALVSVRGRVTSANGQGIRNVRVSLTDSTGNVRSALTSSFGYYRFDDIEAGQTVILSVASKRYTFANPTRVISLVDEISDADFVADD